MMLEFGFFESLYSDLKIKKVFVSSLEVCFVFEVRAGVIVFGENVFNDCVIVFGVIGVVLLLNLFFVILCLIVFDFIIVFGFEK